MVDIKMQVVVGSMLKGDEFAPIRIQKSNVSEDDVRKAVGFFETLVDRADVDMANTIMRISIMGNRDLYARLREVDEMYDAFADLMKDYVEAKVATEVEAKVAAEREGLATRMLQGNYSVVEISRLTDVSEERLAELAEEIGKEPTVRHS